MRIISAIIDPVFAASAVVCVAQGVAAQGKNPGAGVAGKDPSVELWSFEGSVSAYFVPDTSDYVSPVFMADRGRLHLEARYNYEAMETASLWLGCNFSFGEKLVFEVTPMLGGVFGDTWGIAPGCRFSLSRGQVEFSSECEYVFDAESSENNFFYAWSELTWSPNDHFRIGLAGQRTRAYQTDVDIQRGFLVGCTWKQLDFTFYIFNPDRSDPTLVFTVGTSF
jgi:hypothetical protein